MGVIYRPMTEHDIPKVGEILFDSYNGIAARMGMQQKMHNANVGKAWAWQIMNYRSTIKIVAETQDGVAGIGCLNPRGTNGGIGPIAVNPSSQQGLRRTPIGFGLVQAVFKQGEHLESIRGYQEAFNTASFHTGYLCDVFPVETLLNLSYSRKMRDLTGLEQVNPASAGELDELLRYDAPLSTMDRREDFVFYMRWGKILLHRTSGAITGFLACLPGSESVQLGPLVADDDAVAADLYRKAVILIGNRVYRTRTMSRNVALNKTLLSWGFKMESVDLLIVRGPWRPGKAVEACGTFPEGI